MTHEEHTHYHEHGIPHEHTQPHEHSHPHSHGDGKHVHSAAEKKAIINRLSRAIGHMEAVKRMVNNDVDCSEVLIQLAAVRSAINNTGKLILKNHINECIVDAVEQKDLDAIEALNDAIDKFVK
ncbi:MAG: metal-sensing transcriptional repressor [Eubacteriales bacterium]|nr:metal-sensing transcriptional repressor [Eubacteriales bacterium]